ncbi:collagen alpha-2(I) chain-like [Oncorhynchus masou masou]|uniref:collagen alpha-2(I) chain-like n=1 Tax=Oncorhynchus masou masou TaxID=90313 RepID=UPI003183EF5D
MLVADCTANQRNPFWCFDLNVILVQMNKTWEEPLDHCRRQYNDLTSLLSENEQLLVQRMMNSKGAQTDHVWTGLRFFSGFWLWVNGDPWRTRPGLGGGWLRLPHPTPPLWDPGQRGRALGNQAWTGRRLAQAAPPNTSAVGPWPERESIGGTRPGLGGGWLRLPRPTPPLWDPGQRGSIGETGLDWEEVGSGCPAQHLRCGTLAREGEHWGNRPGLGGGWLRLPHPTPPLWDPGQRGRALGNQAWTGRRLAQAAPPNTSAVGPWPERRALGNQAWTGRLAQAAPPNTSAVGPWPERESIGETGLDWEEVGSGCPTQHLRCGTLAREGEHWGTRPGRRLAQAAPPNTHCGTWPERESIGEPGLGGGWLRAAPPNTSAVGPWPERESIGNQAWTGRRLAQAAPPNTSAVGPWPERESIGETGLDWEEVGSGCPTQHLRCGTPGQRGRALGNQAWTGRRLAQAARPTPPLWDPGQRWRALGNQAWTEEEVGSGCPAQHLRCGPWPERESIGELGLDWEEVSSGCPTQHLRGDPGQRGRALETRPGLGGSWLRLPRPTPPLWDPGQRGRALGKQAWTGEEVGSGCPAQHLRCGTLARGGEHWGTRDWEEVGSGCPTQHLRCGTLAREESIREPGLDWEEAGSGCPAQHLRCGPWPERESIGEPGLDWRRLAQAAPPNTSAVGPWPERESFGEPGLDWEGRLAQAAPPNTSAAAPPNTSAVGPWPERESIGEPGLDCEEVGSGCPTQHLRCGTLAREEEHWGTRPGLGGGWLRLPHPTPPLWDPGQRGRALGNQGLDCEEVGSGCPPNTLRCGTLAREESIGEPGLDWEEVGSGCPTQHLRCGTLAREGEHWGTRAWTGRRLAQAAPPNTSAVGPWPERESIGEPGLDWEGERESIGEPGLDWEEVGSGCPAQHLRCGTLAREESIGEPGLDWAPRWDPGQRGRALGNQAWTGRKLAQAAPPNTSAVGPWPERESIGEPGLDWEERGRVLGNQAWTGRRLAQAAPPNTSTVGPWPERESMGNQAWTGRRLAQAAPPNTSAVGPWPERESIGGTRPGVGGGWLQGCPTQHLRCGPWPERESIGEPGLDCRGGWLRLPHPTPPLWDPGQRGRKLGETGLDWEEVGSGCPTQHLRCGTLAREESIGEPGLDWRRLAQAAPPNTSAVDPGQREGEHWGTRPGLGGEREIIGELGLGEVGSGCRTQHLRCGTLAREGEHWEPGLDWEEVGSGCPTQHLRCGTLAREGELWEPGIHRRGRNFLCF